MKQKTKDKIKNQAIGAFFSAVVTIIGAIVTFYLNDYTTGTNITRTLSKYFNSVNVEMSYEEALEAIYRECQSKDETIQQLLDEIGHLRLEAETLEAERTSETIISEAISSSQSYAEVGNYEMALTILRSVSQEDARVMVLAREYQGYYEMQITQQINTLLMNREFDEAKDLLVYALAIVPNNANLIGKEQEINKSYLNYVLVQIDQFIANKDITSAEKLLCEALNKLPDSVELQEKNEYIKNIGPISIAKTVCIDRKNWNVNEGTPIDIFGNSHYSDFSCIVYNDNSVFGNNDNYAEYRTYGKYTTLSGTISPYQYIEGATVKILFDGATKATYEIGKKTDPIDFEFDVSGVDYIRFEVQLLWSSGVIFSDVYLSNL